MCDIALQIWANLMSYTTEDFKNYASGALSLVAMILGILTYRQAKKSIFDPKVTEVYKLQLSEYKAALGFLKNHSLLRDMRHIVVFNLKRLSQDYRLAKEVITPEERMETENKAVGLIRTKEMNVQWSGLGMPSVESWLEHRLESIRFSVKEISNDRLKLSEIRGSLFMISSVIDAFDNIEKQHDNCLTYIYHRLHEKLECIQEEITLKEKESIRSTWVDSIIEDLDKSKEHKALKSALEHAQKQIEKEIRKDIITK